MFYTNKETESDGENSITRQCTSSHEGRLLVDEIFSVHIDVLFTMLFTNSKFFMYIQEFRGISNFTQGPWCDEENHIKKRVLTMTVPLTHSIGPKHANVTETQVMLPCSEPGLLYSIDVKLENGGIPYADRFYMAIHYCLVKRSDQKTAMEIYGDVKYKKSVWGIVKTFIEKNTWQGMDETFRSLTTEIHNTLDDDINTNHKRRRHPKRRRRPSTYRNLDEIKKSADFQNVRKRIDKYSSDLFMAVILFLIFFLSCINIYFYYKLWILESNSQTRAGSLDVREEMTTAYEDFLKRLNENEVVSNSDIERWYRILTDTIKFLKNAEETLQRGSYEEN